ncbi:MAG: 3-phosphoserine/phosphohydroxythreonine transaminase, partial [Deltaproteobacteria bacterium]|nr:3-phosphoserine/phosphohydroxythreonine transaminase [Deltaproteobacteria bacterium]
MGKKVINFYAGPAALPPAPLERARDEMLDFAGTGMSVMEISHRSKDYEAVHDEAIALTKELLDVPDNYKILLLQGGGNLQFCTIPMNFVWGGRKAEYIDTGTWAKRAAREAAAWAKDSVKVIASTAADKYKRLPFPDEIKVSPDAAYLHFTSNNTVEGTQFHEFPAAGNVPLACDMSSDLMWRPFDVKPFGLIYAGAQKNLGPSGLVVVVIRDDMLAQCNPALPAMLKYTTHADANSLYNTPPTWSIYILRNVLAYNKSLGGLAAIEKANRAKGEMLYGCIDRHAGFYQPWVTTVAHRSVMNVDFHLASEEMDARFIAEAKKAGMVGL